MPTVFDFLNAAGTVSVFNAVVFFVGRAMRKSMKRKGQHLRAYHGWYVWVWMMGGVAFGGLFLPWQGPMYHEAPVGVGFLVGWLGGFVHGFLALERAERPLPRETDGE